jgi:hypothetical protein
MVKRIGAGASHPRRRVAVAGDRNQSVFFNRWGWRVRISCIHWRVNFKGKRVVKKVLSTL